MFKISSYFLMGLTYNSYLYSFSNYFEYISLFMLRSLMMQTYSISAFCSYANYFSIYYSNMWRPQAQRRYLLWIGGFHLLQLNLKGSGLSMGRGRGTMLYKFYLFSFNQLCLFISRINLYILYKILMFLKLNLPASKLIGCSLKFNFSLLNLLFSLAAILTYMYM